MKEVQDTLQVGIANSTAIGISLVEANELLTFVSLTLAIGFTIYKFLRYSKKAKKRKLNSNNPKYNKKEQDNVKMRKELVREVKGCKIYKTYYL